MVRKHAITAKWAVEKRSRERRLTISAELPAEESVSLPESILFAEVALTGFQPLPEYAAARVAAEESLIDVTGADHLDTALPRLNPTHLTYRKFGSRFLPHSIAPIRCLVSTMDGDLLLSGTADGLLAMQATVDGVEDSSTARMLISGEAFLHMQIVSLRENLVPGKTPHGTLLALVQPYDTDPGKRWSSEAETARSLHPAELRLYQLGSLVSLARCAFAMDNFQSLSTTAGAGTLIRDGLRRGSVTLERRNSRPQAGMSSMRSLLSRQCSTSSQTSSGSTLFSMMDPRANKTLEGFSGMAWKWALDYQALAGGPECSLGLRGEDQAILLCAHIQSASLVSARPDIIIGTANRIIHLKAQSATDQYTVAATFGLPERPLKLSMMQVSRGGSCICQSKYHNGQCEYLRRLRAHSSMYSRAVKESKVSSTPHIYVEFAIGSCLVQLSDGRVFDVEPPRKRRREGESNGRVRGKIALSVVGDPVAGPSLVINTQLAESEVFPVSRRLSSLRVAI